MASARKLVVTRWIALSALCLASHGGATSLLAQNPPGNWSQFQVNSLLGSEELNPDIAFVPDVPLLPGGGLVAVWHYPDGDHVWARVFDAALNPLGPQFVVNETVIQHPDFHVTDPKVAVDLNTGRFLVIWKTYLPGTGLSDDVLGRLFEADGSLAPNMDKDIIVASTSDRDWNPELIARRDGGFFAVWQEGLGSAGNSGEIMGRSISANGFQGSGIQFNYTSLAVQNEPSVAEHGAGDLTVVWSSGMFMPPPPAPQNPDHAAILGRTLTSAGNFIPPHDDLRINTFTTGNQVQPRIAGQYGTGYVVAWESNPSPDGPGRTVRARMQVGGEFQVETYTSGAQWKADAAMAEDGSFLIAWRSDGGNGTDTSGPSIHARRFDGFGFPLDSQFQVNSYTSGSQLYPSIAFRPGSTDFIIAWQSAGSVGNDNSPALGRSIQAGPCQTSGFPMDDLLPCPGVAVAATDLRGDNDRDGVVEFGDSGDDEDEETWDSTHGAIFLANIDDDYETGSTPGNGNRCPITGTDEELAACHDASNDLIDSEDDLHDLARLKTKPWPEAPTSAEGSLVVSNPERVRIFKKSGSSFDVYIPGSSLTFTELRDGIEFAIEGLDLVRNATEWDGFLDVTFTVLSGGGIDGTDSVRLRQAPVLFPHHLNPAKRVYAHVFNGNQAFRADLVSAAEYAGITQMAGFEDLLPGLNDYWTQDYFESAFMSFPAAGGPHVMEVNFRAPNYPCLPTDNLRRMGRVVFQVLRGRDVAGAVQFDPLDPSHERDPGQPPGTCTGSKDTLNSFGNLEVLPPYSHAGESWPLGRVIRGKVIFPAIVLPDRSFDRLISAQGEQDPIYLDTGWLAVRHIDETISFIRQAGGTHGWKVLVADPMGALKLFQEIEDAGMGWLPVFDGLVPGVTVSSILADDLVRQASEVAASKIDTQVDELLSQAGLTKEDFIWVPFLFEELQAGSQRLTAYQPGSVNGVYLSDQVFAAPASHGPEFFGHDYFEYELTGVLAAQGVTTRFVEDWIYHQAQGEVHCASQVTRDVQNIYWWEGGN